jgi:hypothetical protein
MIAGNDIANGFASSLTEIVSWIDSRDTIARRVGSASAAKVRSSAMSLYLTIRFSIGTANSESSKTRRRAGAQYCG